MCGIAGLVQNQNILSGQKVVERMLQAMVHRGPDDHGIVVSQGAIIGHNRLGILDLTSAGHQPMVSDDDRLVLSYNGEIYNHRQLRDDLGQVKFRGHSDTEVLLKFYGRQGLGCLNSLKGIFAFGVWDRQRKTLTLVRDQLGVKPLYWWQSKDRLIFASEMKGILASQLVSRVIEPEALHHFLSAQAVPAPMTIIKGVKLLAPGSYLIWQNGQVTIKKYWQLEFAEDDSLGGNLTPYIEKSRALVTKAVLSQQQSDVPLSVPLSGGMDSSVITALLASHLRSPVLTFNLRSDDMIKDRSLIEAGYAKLVAQHFNTHHSEVALRRLHFIEQLPQAIWSQGQPSMRNLLAYFLFQEIKNHARVTFYGTGGDEIFAGYGTLRLIQGFQRNSWLVGLTPEVAKKIFRSWPLLYQYFPQADYTFKMAEAKSLYRQRQIIDWIFLDFEKPSLYQTAFRDVSRHFNSERYFQPYADGQNKSSVKVHQQLDWLGIETEHLVQLDAVSMFGSVEARVPLLELDLVSFAAKLPGWVLAPGGQDNKFLLREGFRHLLPQEIIERPKQGFQIDLKHYFGQSFAPLLAYFYNIKAVEKRGIFTAQAIQSLLDDYVAHKPAIKLFEKLYALLCLEIWLRIYIDCDDPIELGQQMAHIDSHAKASNNDNYGH